jgi:hypothetical protein
MAAVCLKSPAAAAVSYCGRNRVANRVTRAVEARP